MALKQIKPGPVQIIVEARTRANTLPRKLTSVPGGLYPMKSAAFEIDEYRLAVGWPVGVPSCDIRSSTLVSGDGSMLADRDNPTAVLTGANYRWVADDDFYNETAVQWVPIQGGSPAWEGDPAHLPTLLSDYEYVIADERFTEMTVLNFDSDTTDALNTNLSRAMSTELGYTLMMVMSPNSVYGNNTDVSFNTLWANPPDPDKTSIELTLVDNYLWVELSDKPIQRGIAMARAVSVASPSYLAVVINRPTLTMYLGQGPSSIAFKTLDIGPKSKPISGDVLLGQHPADTLHNGDMALFDLSIYANPLSADQVKDEFALLSGIYGGQ